MMATQLQTANEQRSRGGLREWIEDQNVVATVDRALGGWMRGEDFLAQLLISMNRPDLTPCTEKSKFAAAHTCATLGLLPSMDHIALIPRNIQGVAEVTVMPQWQGYQSLMLRNPEVLDVQAHLVHKSDELSYDTVSKQVRDHRFDPFDPGRKFDSLDDIRGGYLEVTYADGRPKRYHFVPAEQIRKARSCAQTKKVWDAWFREMALKTIYRDAYNRRVVPLDPMVQKALRETANADDAAMGNDPSRVTVDSRPVEAQQPRPSGYLTKSDELAAQLGASNAAEEPPEPTSDELTDEEKAEIAAAEKAEAGDLFGDKPDGEPKYD